MRIFSLSHSLKTHQIQHVTGRLKNSFHSHPTGRHSLERKTGWCGTPREAEFTHETFYSIQAFWSVAAGIAHFLPKPGIRWANQRFSRSCVFLGWRYPDDSAAILLGNIESGLTGDSMFPSHGKLMTEGEAEIIPHDRSGNTVRVVPGENEFAVTIGAHQFAILSLLKIDQTVKPREDDPSVHSRMDMQPC